MSTQLLKPYEKIFVKEYVNTSNGLQSYLKARPNASTETARVNSSKLLTRTDIQEAVNKAVDKQIEKSLPDRKQVLEKLWDISDLAKDDKQYGSSVNSLREYGKISGMYEEKEDGEGYAKLVDTMLVQINNTQVNQVIVDKDSIPDDQSDTGKEQVIDVDTTPADE